MPLNLARENVTNERSIGILWQHIPAAAFRRQRRSQILFHLVHRFFGDVNLVEKGTLRDVELSCRPTSAIGSITSKPFSVMKTQFADKEPQRTYVR